MSAASMRDEPILKADGLSRYFPVHNAFGMKVGSVRALDGVSFEVRAGETLGIVGESGCGKSTLGKALAGIHALSGGAIEFEGKQISQLSVRERRAVAPRLQYCHQDPGNSLDPRWTIRRSLEEPLVVHTRLGAAERTGRIQTLLRQVGLPQTHLDLYPHELSGGQQRRVGLARILALHPRLVVLDEPTSGLDMSVQATVLKLFNELREAFSLTYLFISHDLSVVRMMCDRVAVMYLGRIVEISPTEDLFSAPQHPYTQSLLAAIPDIGGRRVTDTFSLEGEPPDPARLPSGCRFRTRCPRAVTACAETDPALRPLLPNHAAACLLAG
jgi:oligopeptide/dipeptide ABC transporter ATP-binding protein